MNQALPRPNPIRAAYLHSDQMEQYEYPPECPFKTERAARTLKLLRSTGLFGGAGQQLVAPRAATREELQWFHSPEYIDALRRADRCEFDPLAAEFGLGTGDNPIFEGVYEYSRLGCGASIQAAEMILAGQIDVAFNPSGGFHHARAGRAAGFCYLNDAVLACMLLARRPSRVLYLDLDVHHGDGVQEAFYRRSDVLTMSFHQSGKTLYPGTGFEEDIGEGEGRGYSVNVPLPPGTYDEAYLDAFSEIALPVMTAYAPDYFVIELGMDCLADDPLAMLRLTNNAYADVLRQVLARGRPVLVVGGGGYHVENTTRGWARAWAVLTGQEDEHDPGVGMGGVFMESTDWRGGLRDRARLPGMIERATVHHALHGTIEKVKVNVFPILGISE